MELGYSPQVTRLQGDLTGCDRAIRLFDAMHCGMHASLRLGQRMNVTVKLGRRAYRHGDVSIRRRQCEGGLRQIYRLDSTLNGDLLPDAGSGAPATILTAAQQRHL